jgi:hypothetical protein
MGMRTFLLLAATIVLANEQAVSGQPRPAEITSITATGIRFRVSSGRVVLVNQSLSDCVNVRHGDVDAGSGFSLSIIVAEKTSFDYEHRRAGEHLRIVITADADMTMHRRYEDSHRGVPLLWTQAKSAQSQLTIGNGDDARHYAAENLWALLMQMPRDDRAEFIQLLSVIRPGWRMNTSIEEIAAELVSLSKQDTHSNRSHWQQLVAKLSNDTFRDRRLAKNRLREYGLQLVPYLRALDQRQLDLNQRRLISQLLQDLQGDTDDDPKLVAQWLLADATVWLRLLEHHEPKYRALALDRLPALLRDDVPESSETTAELRRQLDRRTTKVADR